MIFEILTLFPNLFNGAFSDSIIKRAIEKKLVELHLDNIRDYSTDVKHKTVDDYVYGGEPGMLLKAGPVAAAITAAKQRHEPLSPTVIYLSPQGELLRHATVEELLKEKCIVLVCGRYKGIDQRVIDKYVDREISIGDYVLSGGEIAAMVLIDTVTRLVPGVLGDRESAENDSLYNGLLAPSHYTRPEIFEGMAVPEILLGGHHKNIRAWQREQSIGKTKKLRPDLWERYCKRNGIT